MITPDNFIGIIRKVVKEELEKQQPLYKIATVILPQDNKWTVKFAGESQPSEKAYSYLLPYQPQLGDRVLMAKVKGTYVILGKLEG